MDFITNLPRKYCRICFKDKGPNLNMMTEEDRENFQSLTDICLIKTENYLNLICIFCSSKLKNTRMFRDDLIANETRFRNTTIVSMNISNSQINNSKNLLQPLEFLATEIRLNPENQEENLTKIESSEFTIFDTEEINTEEQNSFDFLNECHRKSPEKLRRKFKKKIKASEKNLQTTEDGKAICPHCNKALFKFYLPEHIERLHMKIKYFSCDLCNKSFYHWKSIEAHMEIIHIKKQRSVFENFEFICEICAVRFKKRYQLQEHINTRHKGHRFKCTFPECTLEYLSSKALKNHVESTHNCRLEACEFCGELVRSGQQAYQHKRRKHMDYKFNCSLCPKKFSSASELTIHIKVHAGQKDYICVICAARYHAKKYLNRHIEVAHRKSKFFCKVTGCKSVLCNKDNYRAHVRTVHRNLPANELEEHLKAITTMKPDFMGYVEK